MTQAWLQIEGRDQFAGGGFHMAVALPQSFAHFKGGAWRIMFSSRRLLVVSSRPAKALSSAGKSYLYPLLRWDKSTVKSVTLHDFD